MELRTVQRVVFYNHFKNGDVYLSRPIVEDVMRKVPGKQYVYSHRWAPDLLKDIDGLAHDPSFLHLLALYKPWAFDQATQTVFINTWVGMNGIEWVHQNGMTIALLYQFMSATVKQVFGIELQPLAQCVPAPNFSRFHIGEVDRFVQSEGRRKVLISNGLVESQQSPNFDFTPLIDQLSREFSQILFIPTNPTQLRRENLIHSAEIIRKGGPDLNENGYLSTFCDLVIGRSSGAYTFCINPINLGRPVTFIGFLYRLVEASLGYHDKMFSPKCTFIASNQFDGGNPLQLLTKQVRVVAEQPFGPII